MKKYYETAAFLLGAAVLFSCVRNAEKEESKAVTTIPQAKAAAKTISVELVGTIETRRSYSGLQVIENEKARDAYYNKQKNSNPELELRFNNQHNALEERFIKLGFIRENEFLLNKFKKQTKETTSFKDISGEKITLKFYNDDSSHTHFKIFCRNDSLDINTHAISLQDLDYNFLDIIPGGNKELVFLDDYYISNGDNFYFQVYEIKIH